jgi:hypothetical protein
MDQIAPPGIGREHIDKESDHMANRQLKSSDAGTSSLLYIRTVST